ncbi:MAG: Unknown protein [uncultured Aureispira sp.]|uniref:Uncharacterized protein n=1 Tax=uncultured Aureispira sp. TaxID=1331704 RepID=A0A6S6SBI0_9BACT|nr:MAG: Unknown protein [uncultured Aureispira sp.]
MVAVVREKDFLYKNFLVKKMIYNQNESYWKRYVRNALEPKVIEHESWLENEYANGTKIYDGNPIYSAKLHNQKAIRIIQEEPESDTRQIAAWVEETEDEHENKIEELVISLELTRDTRKLALELIKEWASKISMQKMLLLIEEKID